MAVAQPRAAVEGALPRGALWLERAPLLGAVMLAPALVYILAFVAFPFGFALYLSLTDATVGNPYGSWVGLRNFVEIVQSPTFLRTLKNTFVFTVVSQLLILILAKVLALALYRDFRGKGLVTFLILLPWAAPISLFLFPLLLIAAVVILRLARRAEAGGSSSRSSSRSSCPS